VRSWVDNYDAGEEASRGGRGGRVGKEHVRDGCDKHRTGIRGDDDGIKSRGKGSRWGLDRN
jgi:hypothetical protein